MKLEIEISEEFECDFNGDRFKDFFNRIIGDIKDGTLCGNYEIEIAEELMKAFEKASKI